MQGQRKNQLIIQSCNGGIVSVWMRSPGFVPESRSIASCVVFRAEQLALCGDTETSTPQNGQVTGVFFATENAFLKKNLLVRFADTPARLPLFSDYSNRLGGDVFKFVSKINIPEIICQYQKPTNFAIFGQFSQSDLTTPLVVVKRSPAVSGGAWWSVRAGMGALRRVVTIPAILTYVPAETHFDPS